MEDLIKAFKIFSKYTKSKHPTCCEHDELFVLVDVETVSKEDIEKLEKLGFEPNDNGNFSSYRFGSA